MRWVVLYCFSLQRLSCPQETIPASGKVWENQGVNIHHDITAYMQYLVKVNPEDMVFPFRQKSKSLLIISV